MALEDILTAIEGSGQRQLAEIRSEHEARLLELKEREQKEISKEETAEKEKFSREAARLQAEAETRASQRRHNRILASKQKILNRVYDKCLKRLLSLAEEKSRSVLKKCLTALGDEKGTIKPAAAHAKLVGELIKDKPHFELGETVESVGGFYFESENLEKDFLFETMVKDILRPRTESDIANKLFHESV